MMIERLALGTAQFGMKYGISNSRGEISEAEVHEIFTQASRATINLLDTASSYGVAEERIGKYLHNNSKSFRIVSKVPSGDSCDIEGYVKKSLKNLCCSSMYGLLVHDYSPTRFTRAHYEVLVKLKKQGLVDKIGFSLYFPEELDQLQSSNYVYDLVQIPLNIADQRFLPRLAELKRQNIEIHSRSVFLQGLLLMEPDTVPIQLAGIKTYLKLLRSHALETSQPLEQLALHFVLQQSEIDKVIIGVDSIQTLLRNLQAVKNIGTHKSDIVSDFSTFALYDEKFIIPSKWYEAS